ncbi:hypothetical protein A7982_13145 [Minicystis rosea]|nr:hypothetical protein A7982_13145 [Minicystis rosea]
MIARPTTCWIDPRTLDGDGRRDLCRFVARYEDISFPAPRVSPITCARSSTSIAA